MNTLSPAFGTDHLHSHWALLIIHKSFSRTTGTFTRCCSWFAFTSLTHRTQSCYNYINTFLLNCHFFLNSVHSFHEIHVNLHEDIWSFGSTRLLFSEISEKFIKICKKFLFLSFILFIALFKKISESAERVKTSLS